jgi:hypothetical protein
VRISPRCSCCSVCQQLTLQTISLSRIPQGGKRLSTWTLCASGAVAWLLTMRIDVKLRGCIADISIKCVALELVSVDLAPHVCDAKIRRGLHVPAAQGITLGSSARAASLLSCSSVNATASTTAPLMSSSARAPTASAPAPFRPFRRSRRDAGTTLTTATMLSSLDEATKT